MRAHDARNVSLVQLLAIKLPYRIFPAISCCFLLRFSSDRLISGVTKKIDYYEKCNNHIIILWLPFKIDESFEFFMN